MAFGNQEAALLFKIKGDTSDADRALASLDAKTSGLSGGLGALGGAFTAAAAGAAAFAAIAVNVGSTLFSLAQKTAEYGSQIKDAADKTGLSATSLSALKVAADQSGSSLEQVASSVTKFSKLIGDAATGSKEATEKLIRLGVDPQDAINDLDGALEKVFKRILDAPPGVEQTKLAMDAFGKSGADILPVLKSFDGDMDALIKRAKEMGVVFDDEAAAAADDFGDTLDSLTATVQGLAMTMAREFLPAITDVMRELQDWLSTNRDAAKNWGTVTANAIREIREEFSGLSSWMQSDQGQAFLSFYRAVTFLSGVGAPFVSSIELLKQGYDQLSEPTTVGGSMKGRAVYGEGGGTLRTGGGGGRRRGGGGRSDGGARRELAAEIQVWRNYLSELQRLHQEAYEAAEKIFLESGNAEEFRRVVGQNNLALIQGTEDTLAKLRDLENRQAEKEKKTQSERRLMQDDQEKRAREANERTVDASEKAEKAITDNKKKETDERKKLADQQMRYELELKRAQSERFLAEVERDRSLGTISEVDYLKRVNQEKIGLLETEKKLLQTREQTAETVQRLKILEQELAAETVRGAEEVRKALEEINRVLRGEDSSTAGPGGDPGESGDTAGEGGGGIFGAWSKSWKEFFGMVTGDGPKLGEMLGSLAGMMQNAFAGIAQGIGSVVSNWVLMGETGPAVMRKLLASALASLAAEAATRAVFELAMGFAALFFNPAEAAAHFTAAALFGSIAVGTALLGRAVAGDSFKQKTSAGAATGANTQSSRSGSGGAYSGQDQMTVNGGRNAPAGRSGVLVIKDRSGMFDKLFEAAWQNNGTMRRRLMQEFST